MSRHSSILKIFGVPSNDTLQISLFCSFMKYGIFKVVELQPNCFG